MWGGSLFLFWLHFYFPRGDPSSRVCLICQKIPGAACGLLLLFFLSSSTSSPLRQKLASPSTWLTFPAARVPWKRDLPESLEVAAHFRVRVTPRQNRCDRPVPLGRQAPQKDSKLAQGSNSEFVSGSEKEFWKSHSHTPNINILCRAPWN